MRIRILVAAAALVGVAGCAGGGTATAGPALPATRSAPAPATSAPATSGPATPGSTAPPTRSGPSSGAPSLSRCHTAGLSASLTPGDPGAGQRFATLMLTNTSTRACTIFGYGGLQPLDAAKQQLPITLSRNTGRPPRLIQLAPGTSVGRTIHWNAVPPSSQPCPIPVYAAIIPPDETSALVIGWSLGPVCGTTMDGWPYGVTL